MRSNPLITCKVFALVFVFCALAAAPASAQTGGTPKPQKPQRPTVLFPNERRQNTGNRKRQSGTQEITSVHRHPLPLTWDNRKVLANGV